MEKSIRYKFITCMALAVLALWLLVPTAWSLYHPETELSEMPSWMPKTAMKLGLEPPSAELRYDITLVHALADRHRAAVAEAVEVAAAPEVTGREMLGLAAACALSADAAVRDELTPTGERSDLQEQYCLRAIEILRRAEQRGLFRAPAAIDQLRQNPDFAQLHSRDDFNMLVSEMRATLATE